MSVAPSFATAFTAIVIAASVPAVSAAQDRPDYRRVVPLIATSQTIMGERLAYPGGAAKVTSAIVTLRPGESTGRHKHGVPTYGYVLSGAVTVDYGAGGTRTYRAGTAFMEAMEVWHDGANTGAEPCRILVVFMGADSAANVIKK